MEGLSLNLQGEYISLSHLSCFFSCLRYFRAIPSILPTGIYTWFTMVST